MINVLVTGSRGFLGSTLRKQLCQDPNIRILEFTRGDSDQLLSEYTKVSDFIYHFAGEVRPNSLDSDFKSSNSDLTEKLISSLINEGKNTPVLYASSIHAINPKNTYGATKFESEKFLETYSVENKAPVWIYRLPHVFGPGCKPNYNSVVSTWIYNSLNGLEINVYDRDIAMNYCYSESIANDFVSHVYEDRMAGCFHVKPNDVYNTTLGSLADLILKFQSCDTVNVDDFVKDSFEERLFITYESYAMNK